MSNIDLTRIVTAAQKADAARKTAIARAMAHIRDTLEDPGDADIPESERRSWPGKEAAARAIVTGRDSPADRTLLEIEAEETGETLRDLAAKIVAHAVRRNARAAWAAGMRRSYRARILAAERPEDIAGILAGFDAQCGKEPPRPD